MSIIQNCTRPVTYLDDDANIHQVARMMRSQHVGCIVIVDSQGRPEGIVTDRDLVMEILAENIPADSVLVRDIMTPNPVCIDQSDDLSIGLQKMRAKAVRRAPVIDEEGRLSGIISVDDIMTFLGAELNNIITLINKGRLKEKHERS